MAILDSLRRLFGRNPTPPPGLSGDGALVRGHREPPDNGAAGVLSLANTSIALAKPISKIRESIQQVSFYVTKEGEQVSEGAVHELLRRPNSSMSGAACRALEVMYLDLLGESFAVIREGEDGLEYMPVPPTWVEILPGEALPYKIRLGSVDFRFSADEVVHYRRLNASDPYGRGVGLGQVAVDEAESEEYASKYAKSFFYNSARPEHLIVLDPGEYGQDAVQQAQAKFDEVNRGFSAAWRTYVVGGAKIDVKQLTSQFKDLNMVEFRRAQQDFVRELYGIPPEVFGQLESSNRATVTMALEIYGRAVIDPRCSFLSSEYNAKLIPRLELMGYDVAGEAVEFKSSVPRDREFALTVMQSRPEAFTLNEWRILAGERARDDGNVYLRKADEWEVIEAADIISMTPLKATPPPIPRKRLPTDGSMRLRIVSNDKGASDIELIMRELEPERIEYPLYAAAQTTLKEWARAEYLRTAQEQGAPSDSILNPFVTRYLDEYGAESVKEINATTRAAIKAQLIEGVRAGEGSRQLAARLRDMPDMDRSRAELIARTETARAANAGKLTAYKLNPAVQYKRWVATSGARTRPQHQQLSGQIRAVDMPFEYGGMTAMHPGGWGTAAMDARCRCTIVAHFPEDMELALKDQIKADSESAEAFDAALKSADEALTLAIYDALQAQLNDDIIPAIYRVLGQEAA